MRGWVSVEDRIIRYSWTCSPRQACLIRSACFEMIPFLKKARGAIDRILWGFQRIIQITREETRCRNFIVNFYRVAARDFYICRPTNKMGYNALTVLVYIGAILWFYFLVLDSVSELEFIKKTVYLHPFFDSNFLFHLVIQNCNTKSDTMKTELYFYYLLLFYHHRWLFPTNVLCRYNYWVHRFLFI